MARQPNVGVDNNFSQGLITQATGLNFPANSCTETYDCIFSEIGPVSRRQGFDFESGYTTKTINRIDSSISTYTWRNVSGDGSVNLYVVQVGETLYFYNILANGTISSGALSTTVNLNTFKPTSAPSPSLNECRFSSGLGYLFVTHATLNPFYVSYNATTSTATATQINIMIRDITGLDDTLAVDNRPATLSDSHNYNLRNQGWSAAQITSWQSANTTYPSNADVWWIYRNTSNNFDPTLINNFSRGTAAAPRGKFILNAFLQDRSTASGVAGISNVTTSYNRPTVSAFFAGRVFYAGVKYTGFDSKIFFSQIIEDVTTQAGKCYQAADPSSESLFELTASDGGVINIPGAGIIHNIAVVGTSLVVFAANGVWAVTGNQGIGFTPLDYSVVFVSNTRTVSPVSFVDISGSFSWWNNDGINIITIGQQGNLSVSSLTDSKIKDFFADIPLSSKLYARGNYNPKTKIITWLYRSSVGEGTLTTTYEYDRCLNFNTLSGAFYPWTISASTVKVHSVATMEGVGSLITTLDVVNAGGDLVIDGSGNQVIITDFSASLIPTVDKFLVSYLDSGSYKFTFAEVTSTRYLDFYTYNTTGVDYTSYFVTGYKVETAGQRKFQSNYLYVFSENITNASYTIQSIWNYGLVGDSALWSQTQPMPTNAFIGIVRNRFKIRGTGHSLQFRYESVTGKPFTLHGWTFYETANAGI